jgi:hypothetical protein
LKFSEEQWNELGIDVIRGEAGGKTGELSNESLLQAPVVGHRDDRFA